MESSVGTPPGTPPHGTYRMAARRSLGRKRRHRFDGEPGAGRRGGTGHTQRGVDRGRCRSWSRAPCRWQRANMCRCTRRPTPKTPTSTASASNSRPTTRANAPNWRRSTSVAASTPRSPNRSPTSSWPMMPSAHMPATNSASPRLSAHVRSRPHSHRPRVLPWARRLPLIVAALVPQPRVIVAVSATTLVFLAALGALAARTGGAPLTPSVIRVTFWGALAMAITAGVGALFGTVV